MTDAPSGDGGDGGSGGERRQARERALGFLYEAEARGVTPAEVVDRAVAPDPYAADLAVGVGDHVETLDAHIGAHAHDWRVERMPAVDRALLRMATYELCHRPDVPTGVILSEAVDLAARYSTEDSSRFVNGVLAAVAEEVRGEDAPDGLER